MTNRLEDQLNFEFSETISGGMKPSISLETVVVLKARLSQIRRQQSQLRYQMKKAGAFKTHDRLMTRFDDLTSEFWQTKEKLMRSFRENSEA